MSDTEHPPSWLDAVAARDAGSHEHPRKGPYTRETVQDRRHLLRLVGQLREAVRILHAQQYGECDEPSPNCGCLGCMIEAALAACEAETPPTEEKEPPR